MTASMWSPGGVISDVDQDTVNVAEYATATAGQTVFDLSSLIYVPGSGKLRVYKNGALMTAPGEVIETSSTRVTLGTACAEGDRIGFVLTVSDSFSASTPAEYAADAKAAADAAIAAAAYAADTAHISAAVRGEYNTFLERGTSSANMIIADAITGPIPSLELDKHYRVTLFRVKGPNTGSVFVSLTGILGYTYIKKVTAAGVLVTLTGGELVPNMVYDLVLCGYTSVAPNPYWLLVGERDTQSAELAEVNILRQYFGIE